MTKKYSTEEHILLSQSILIIMGEMYKVRNIIYEDQALLIDLKNASKAFEKFSRKMLER